MDDFKTAWETAKGVISSGFLIAVLMAFRRVGKIEQTQKTQGDDIKELQASDFITMAGCTKEQRICQQHTQDALLLVLEKRDREFDRKFSEICRGIGEIKAEMKNGH